jgi:hypothetical protein
VSAGRTDSQALQEPSLDGDTVSGVTIAAIVKDVGYPAELLRV